MPRKKKAPTPLQQEYSRLRKLEQEFSPFTGVVFAKIDEAAAKHLDNQFCHRDLSLLSRKERKEVRMVLRHKIASYRRLIWLGEEEP